MTTTTIIHALQARRFEKQKWQRRVCVRRKRLNCALVILGLRMTSRKYARRTSALVSRSRHVAGFAPTRFGR